MRKEGLHARVGLQLVSHQAAMLAGEGAMGMWMFCTMYSRLHELDGFVPLDVAERAWSGNLRANRAHLRKLCTASVHLAIPGSHPTLGPGFVMLKYSEFNETKAEIEERRAQNRSRQNAHRKTLSRVTNALVTDSDSDSGSVSEDPELGSGSPREAFVEAATAPTSPAPAPCRPPDPFGATFLAQSYVDGQADAGVEDFPTPSGPAEIRALDEMARRAHAKGREPCEWIRAESKAYRVAQRPLAQYQCGFSAVKCVQWIGNGRPVAPVASGPHLRAVPDTPPAPYHVVRRGYERDGDEIDTGAAAGGVLAALGGGA